MFFRRYKNLTKFKPYYSKYRPLLALLIFNMVIASSMGMVIAYLLSEQLIAISNLVISNMVKFTILIVVGIFLHHLCWFFWDKISAVIGNKIARDIRGDIFENTLGTKYSIIKNKMAGYYLERLGDDTNEVSFFVQNVAGTLVDVLTNVSFLVIIFVLNWQCGLLFSAGLVVLYLIDLVKIRVELSHTQKIKLTEEQLTGNMTEAIHGIRDIKGLGIKNEIIEKSKDVSSFLSRQRTKMKRDVTLVERIRTFFQWIIDAALVLACALWLFPSGQILVVTLLIIFNYKSLMYDTVGFFSKMKGYYVHGDFRAGRILEIIQDHKNQDKFGDQEVKIGKNTIEVRNLSFAYENKKVLENVSFSLAENSASVLIGQSGSGKSTLFSLISKLNDCENEKIFIGESDINTLSEKIISSHMVIVNQEPFIFHGSVIENLLLVNKNADRTEVENACKLANIYDEIFQMENGFETLLTENGTNLSGGQKQRLSIARAILKDCPIILFDEPTSSLDRQNQSLFLNTLGKLKETKTIFVIAHKLESYDVFDNVFEIKNRKVERI